MTDSNDLYLRALETIRKVDGIEVADSYNYETGLKTVRNMGRVLVRHKSGLLTWILGAGDLGFNGLIKKLAEAGFGKPAMSGRSMALYRQFVGRAYFQPDAALGTRNGISSQNMEVHDEVCITDDSKTYNQTWKQEDKILRGDFRRV